MTHGVVLHESGVIDVAELESLAAKGLLVWRVQGARVSRYALLAVAENERAALDLAAELRREQRGFRQDERDDRDAGERK